MKKFINSHKYSIIGVLLGATSGYFYWYFVGCASGTCAIQSVWYNATFFGALMGYLAGSSFSDYLKSKDKAHETHETTVDK